MWVDSHCHIPYEGLGVEAIEEARAAGVGRMVTVGTDAEQSAEAVRVARSHEGVWATVGLHPHDAAKGVGSLDEVLAGVGAEVVAIGECGLDYHYDLSPREDQRMAFSAQIRLANERDLALVIHTREAWGDTFGILEQEGLPERTVFHCFTGGPAELRRAISLGGYVSFSGIVTFKGATDVRDAASSCPLDRVMVETDSPYLAPVPHRGETNGPKYVPLVGAAVASALDIPVEAVEEATWSNTEAVFRLAPGSSVEHG